MESLSGPQYQDALLRIGLLCELRRRKVPEQEVAEKLGFGGVGAMHVQLANWGLPRWLIGKVPGSESDKTERRGMTATEEPAELPPAYDALPLFNRALQKLNRAIGDLENRKEYLQNGRFVAHESTGQGDWPEMGIEEGTLTIPLGGQQPPLEPLPALIGAYFLADEPLEPLLEKLNRWPQSVDTAQIQALIEGEKTPKGHTRGLKSIVGMIARGIRGGAIRPGLQQASSLNGYRMGFGTAASLHKGDSIPRRSPNAWKKRASLARKSLRSESSKNCRNQSSHLSDLKARSLYGRERKRKRLLGDMGSLSPTSNRPVAAWVGS